MTSWSVALRPKRWAPGIEQAMITCGIRVPAALLAALFALLLSGTDAEASNSIARRLGSHAALGAVAVFSNDKILVAGYSTGGGLTIARYDRDGRLDSSFGRDGITTTGYRYRPATILQRPSGGAVVLGAFPRGICSSVFACAGRIPVFGFTPQGHLDPRFGDGGISRVILGTRGAALVAQPHGRIIVAGSDRVCSEGCTSGSGILARLLPNGSLDPTFGEGGVAHLPRPAGSFSAVATELDGSILAAGSLWSEPATPRPILARFSREGVFDPSFGGGGIAGPPPGFRATAFESIALTESTVTVAGSSEEGISLARYSLDGRSDFGFRGGVVSTTFGNMNFFFDGKARLLGIANHRLYVTSGPIGVGCRSGDHGRNLCRTGFGLARFTGSGSLDADFAPGGVIRTSTGRGRSDRLPFALPAAIAAGLHGRVVIAGSARLAPTPHRRARDAFAIAVYSGNGDGLDTGFGHRGLVMTPSFGR